MNSRDAVTPANDEAVIEKEIQEKGLTAPRITPEMIDSKIKDRQVHVFENSCLTVVCLTLQNGFTVTGESACASPENFNAEIGEKIAFRNARDKIWALEGYLLREKLTAAQQLKAEIAALIPEIEQAFNYGRKMSFDTLMEKLRKLSAV